MRFFKSSLLVLSLFLATSLSAYATSNPTTIPVVSSVAALQALGSAAPQYPNIYVVSYTANSGHGGGVFIWNPTSTATVDSCNVFQATGVTTGRYIRQLSGSEYSINNCGAVPNGADPTAAIRAATTVSTGILTADPGTYTVSGTIQFGNIIGRANGFDGHNAVNLGGSLPAPDSFLADGSSLTYTLGAPANGDVFTVLIGAVNVAMSYQDPSTYSISGSTITFVTPPAGNAHVLIYRDIITVASNNGVFKDFVTGGSTSANQKRGGDIINVRAGTFIHFDNIAMSNGSKSGFAITPTSTYGAFVENIFFDRTTCNYVREACYLKHLTPNSFINIEDDRDAHARSNALDTATVGMSSGSNNFTIASGYQMDFGDVGRYVEVTGCGSSSPGSTLVSNITSVTDATHGTFLDNATADCSGAATLIGQKANILDRLDNQSSGAGSKIASWNCVSCEADNAFANSSLVIENVTGGSAEQFTVTNPNFEATSQFPHGYAFNTAGFLSGLTLINQNGTCCSGNFGINYTLQTGLNNWTNTGPNISEGAISGQPVVTFNGAVGISNPGGLVSGLPTCTLELRGQRLFVTDSNTSTFFATVAGGGSNAVSVICGGTNWTVD